MKSDADNVKYGKEFPILIDIPPLIHTYNFDDAHTTAL